MPSSKAWKPSKTEILAAADKRVPDLIAADLNVLFCGINPGLYSAAVGHHFARPGNRFWPALYQAGFSDRLLTPFEERELLGSRYGITNLVNRATATADALTGDELVAGARKLARKVIRYRPDFVAFVGVTAYRTGFARREAVIGKQDQAIGESKIWVLPNPSGLNAHHQLPKLIELFRELRLAVEADDGLKSDKR